MLKLDAMALFAQVAQSGSFTAAAQLCGLPKSTVSQRVAELEQALDLRLLHRTTRKLSLTAAGQVYLQHCQTMLEAAHAADAAMSGLRRAPSGSLRITTPDASGRLLLPGLITRFRQRYPDVAIECLITDHQLDLVAERIDLALRTGKQPDSSFVSRHIGKVRRVLVAAPDYLARKGWPQHPDQLAAHRLLRHDAAPRWPLRHGGDVLQLEVAPGLGANNLSYLQSLAEQGNGIALLPWFMVSRQLQDGTLATVLPDFPPTDNHYYAVYPARRQLPAALSALLAFIEEDGLAALLA